MPINTNIAMGYRGVELPQQNALADYAAIQQIQGGQRQAEVAQMQLDKMRREESALDRMMEEIVAKGGPRDPMVAADAMIRSKIPQYVETGFKLQAAARQRTEDMAAMGLSPAGGAAAAAPVSEPYPGYNESIGMPAPTNALAPAASEPYPGYNEAIGMTPSVNAMAPAAAPSVNAMASSADRDAQIRSAKLKMLSPTAGVRDAGKMELEKLLAPPPFRSVAAGASVLGPDNKVIFTAPAAPPAPTTLARLQAELALLPKGNPRIPAYEAMIKKETEFAPRTAEGGAGKAPAGYRYTKNNELEPIPGGPAAPGLSPKDIQKREAVFPQATSSVKSFETRSEQFIRELEKLRDDPGLNQITGAIYGRTPSVSREGSRAQALYDKIFAKGGFQALQDMREASKTGGALGNVSNEEGRRLEKSVVGGLDRTQNIADVKQGINDFIDEIRVSQARVREAYDTTYAYKGGAAPPPSAPGAAPAANVVVTPDGQSHTFPTPAAAAQFKKAAGL